MHERDPGDEGLVVGVDIGGTKVLGGVVEVDGSVVSLLRRATPHRSTTPDVVESTIVEVVHELAAGRPVSAVGVGAAGFVDTDGAVVRFSPHLSWRDEPLRDALQGRLGLPVAVDNDANVTALAESTFGAGRGFRNIVCLTLGTGIGGALVLDGRVYRGSNGMAGEFGHMQVVPDGRACECGNRGCWEQYASGNVLVRGAQALAASGAPEGARLGQRLAAQENGQPGAAVTGLALEGDAAALALFEEVGAWLGRGLASLVAAFDPELLVVGGGLSAAGELLLRPARETMRASVTGRGFRKEPALVGASLGPEAGVIGAATLARSLL